MYTNISIKMYTQVEVSICKRKKGKFTCTEGMDKRKTLGAGEELPKPASRSSNGSNYIWTCVYISMYMELRDSYIRWREREHCNFNSDEEGKPTRISLFVLDSLEPTSYLVFLRSNPVGLRFFSTRL